MHVQYQLLVVILQNGNDTMAERETEFELSYFFLFPINYPTDDDKLICYFTVKDQKGIVCIGSE